jgi:hypothetical protein
MGYGWGTRARLTLNVAYEPSSVSPPASTHTFHPTHHILTRSKHAHPISPLARRTFWSNTLPGTASVDMALVRGKGAVRTRLELAGCAAGASCEVPWRRER